MIVTHTNPDLDAIAGVWLLKKFGSFEDEPVAFVNTGNPDQDLLVRAVAVVDTCNEFDPDRLRFDHHHLPGVEANATCATKMIFEFLAQDWSQFSHLVPLINMVFFGDTGRPEANASRELGLHAIFSGYKAWWSEQNPGERLPDEALLAYGFGLLDVLEVRLRKQSEAKAELAEKTVYQSDDGLIWAIKHGSASSTFAAYEQGARLVLFEGGPIEVEGGATYPVGIFRAGEWQEPHVGELAERVAVSKPFAEEIDRWFKHPAGFFAGRGTAKAPVFEPVSIDLAALAEAVDAVWIR